MQDTRNKGEEKDHQAGKQWLCELPTPEATPDLSTEHSPAPPWSSQHNTPPGRASL